jgi:hypothetical protein
VKGPPGAPVLAAMAAAVQQHSNARSKVPLSVQRVYCRVDE